MSRSSLRWARACTRTSPSEPSQYRLNKAYEFAAAHRDTLVITSGGQGRDEWCPEGDATAAVDYLIAKGLEPARVISEGRSTSTEENFAFSLAILRQHGYDETTPIVYVSNAFHCYRAGKYAAMAGFTNATELAAGTPLRSVLPRQPAGGAGTFVLLGIQDFRHRADAYYGRFAGHE